MRRAAYARGIAMMRVKAITIALTLIAIAASTAYSEHERFIVGAMRNVDPSAETITSTSGACVPSHDRERLDCYFTTFGLWKAKNEEQVKKDKKEFEQLVQEMKKDSA